METTTVHTYNPLEQFISYQGSESRIVGEKRKEIEAYELKCKITRMNEEGLEWAIPATPEWPDQKGFKDRSDSKDGSTGNDNVDDEIIPCTPPPTRTTVTTNTGNSAKWTIEDGITSVQRRLMLESPVYDQDADASEFHRNEFIFIILSEDDESLAVYEDDDDDDDDDDDINPKAERVPINLPVYEFEPGDDDNSIDEEIERGGKMENDKEMRTVDEWTPSCQVSSSTIETDQNPALTLPAVVTPDKSQQIREYTHLYRCKKCGFPLDVLNAKRLCGTFQCIERGEGTK
jgi:hypothetical protein